MEWSDLLDFLARTMSELQIEYFVTGSSATITYGEPRFTNDIDIVAILKSSDVDQLCEAFSAPEFYLSREAVQQAILRRRMFNIIHPTSGLKIDVAVPAENEFNESRRARTVEVKLKTATRVSFASPEDVILKKMEYFREGGSEKHLRDITGVLRICDRPIDRDYISRWATSLNVEGIWGQILQRLDEPPKSDAADD
jgi:hypothetical protein